ncbi:MAG: very short patch repair endonuclease [Steroidobacteraceae bacterium]
MCLGPSMISHQHKRQRRSAVVDPLRSKIMRAVRREGTTPELRVRRAAHLLGFRFRLHRRDLPGTPDVVFPRFRTVVFVHGCFWHRHRNCPGSSTPKVRAGFWRDKFEANVRRDARTANDLQELGWRVCVVWECETVDFESLTRRIARLVDRGEAATRIRRCVNPLLHGE